MEYVAVASDGARLVARDREVVEQWATRMVKQGGGGNIYVRGIRQRTLGQLVGKWESVNVS